MPFSFREFTCVVDFAEKPPQAAFQFFDAHFFGLEINVEQSAPIPEPILKQSPFTSQSIIKRCARERSKYGKLRLKQIGLSNEIANRLEYFSRMRVEAKHKASVYTDATRLNFIDRFEIGAKTPFFPIMWIQPVQAFARRTF